MGKYVTTSCVNAGSFSAPEADEESELKTRLENLHVWCFDQC